MDLIYTDTDYNEIGYLKKCEIDIELGLHSSSKNDFQITMAIDELPKEIEEGSIIYEYDSEFGGIINGIGADTSLNKAYIYGICWRGKIAQEIIEPPPGQAYYNARGEANKALSDLIDSRFDGLITTSTKMTDIIVNRDFRFTNLLEGIEKMLSNAGARLKIEAKRNDDKIKVIVSAVHVTNYSNEIELNNDYGIAMIAKKIKNGVNHVICLGSGELTERTVIHLYKLKNGTVTTDSTNAIKGIKQNTIIYDYSSAETEDDLIEGGKKKFAENADQESLEIKINMNVEIGDIVAARERVTGIYMQKAITQKIVKGYIDRTKIEYKVGD